MSGGRVAGDHVLRDPAAMTPHYEDPHLVVWLCDTRAALEAMEPESVDCIVTSPPYYSLRDYGLEPVVWGGELGHAHEWGPAIVARNEGWSGKDRWNHQVNGQGLEYEIVDDRRRPEQGAFCGCGAWRGQLGLEPDPFLFIEHIVEVFRAARRVLRADGTLWLNLGDSYASKTRGSDVGWDKSRLTNPGYSQKAQAASMRSTGQRHRGKGSGFKEKDRMMMPARVAMALQEPYYTGRIKDERDRIWLAAMLDAEGCMYIHRRPAGGSVGGGRTRPNDSYSPGIEIANTSLVAIERIVSLVGKGSVSSQGPEENPRRKQRIYRWHIRSSEAREFVRELYPHLVAKQHQARVMLGAPSSGVGAAEAHAALKALHAGQAVDVDFKPPASMFEPGWYLRDEVIWMKPNPMPSSVEDRTTPSHEMVYLLTKSARYRYDAPAIREGLVSSASDLRKMIEGKERIGGRVLELDDRRMAATGLTRVGRKRSVGSAAAAEATLKIRQNDALHANLPVAEGLGRNKRSVWTVATEPYPEAHFATFPEKLIEPMILAGVPERKCPECGAAWERQTSVTYDAKGRTTNGPRSLAQRHETAGFAQRLEKSVTTTGWAPGCDHGHEPVGGVVLDPFGGSGTVAVVAQRLGRRAVLVDLSPEYVEQMIRRIGAARGAGEGPALDMPVPFADDGLWAAEGLG